MLRDLLVLKGDKELSFGERKMLDTARSLLVKELSIAKAHPEEKIMEELEDDLRELESTQRSRIMGRAFTPGPFCFSGLLCLRRWLGSRTKDAFVLS